MESTRSWPGSVSCCRGGTWVKFCIKALSAEQHFAGIQANLTASIILPEASLCDPTSIQDNGKDTGRKEADIFASPPLLLSNSSPFGQMRGWDQTASIDWQDNRILVIFRRKLDHLENTSQCAGESSLVSLQFHCCEACVIVIILCSWYPSSQNASMCPACSGTASLFTVRPWGSGRGRGQDLGARICSFLWSCQK